MSVESPDFSKHSEPQASQAESALQMLRHWVKCRNVKLYLWICVTLSKTHAKLQELQASECKDHWNWLAAQQMCGVLQATAQWVTAEVTT